MDMQRSKQAITKVPCMQSGDGADSYAKSSLPQNFAFNVYAKPHLSQALDNLCSSPLLLEALHIHRRSASAGLQAAGTVTLVHAPATLTAAEYSHDPAGAIAAAKPHSEYTHYNVQKNAIAVPCSLVMADFGCSHGRNTLDTAAFVLQGIQERLTKALIISNVEEPIEMQYFFSDLPDNNFNSIFQSLPGFLHQLQQSPHAPYFKIFTGAVAGSFHDALFPSNSLHFATSSYSLHWLSQVPEEVLDKESEAWNGGHIWLDRERPKVMEAYARQHQKDMRSFFQNRARELAKGGVLFLVIPCGDDDIWSELFEPIWTDMVCEGLISEEERDAFNIPFYMCHEDELQVILEDFVGELELVDCLSIEEEDEQSLLEDPQVRGKFWANFIASLMRPMVQAHLDEARTLEFFERLEDLATLKAHHYTSTKTNILMAVIRRL